MKAPLVSPEEHRRRVSGMLASFDPAPDGLTEEARDAYYMDLAVQLARAAAEEGEVPVGCVIVRRDDAGDRLLSGDYNGRETFRDAAYHAETAAISAACRKLGGWRLIGCTLYVTLEPCPMCAGAVWNARIPRVVIGAKDPKAGAMGSLLNLGSYPLNFKPEVLTGVREKECRELLRSFFERKRKK